jgi:hypothetical protein
VRRKPIGPRSRPLASIALLALLGLLAALVPSPARADEPAGQFWVRCRFSHAAMDDPIVFPGQPGASHMHDFFGNKTTNADSTESSMLAGATTCRIPSDTAGYWSPSASVGGVTIKPPVMRIYYLGVRDVTVETIPPGLKIIGGNKEALSPADNPHVFWYCGETMSVKTPKMDTPYDCGPWAQYRFVDGVVGVVDLPNCWDGVGLEPSDVVYQVGGGCPLGFDHALPRVSERVHFGVMNPLNPDGTVGLTLSSGPYYTLHADFWNTWQQPRLDQLVADCLVAHIGCGSVTPAPKPEWTREFGTLRYDLALGLAESNGRVFVVGSTNLALPGQDFRARTDAFVRAYGQSGAELWTDEFGTSGIDQALAVTATGSAIYVVGSTDQALHGQKHRAGVDAFVRAYSLRGDVLWTREFGSTGDDQALAVDANAGGVYVAGTTDGRLGDTRWGGVDGFVRKYSLAGAELWTNQVGTLLTDDVRAVAVNSLGVYVAGSTDGAFEHASAGGFDGFVRAYRPNGAKWWVSEFGTTGTDGIRGIVAGPSAIYVAGSTDGTFEEQVAQGGLDGFVRRLDHHGNEVWTRQFGSPGTDDVQGIDVTADGIFVAGSTDGAFPDQVPLGETDAFLAKYNPTGVQLWATQLGTADFDAGSALTASTDAAYVAGETHGAFEGQVNEGDRDAFVTKIGFA